MMKFITLLVYLLLPIYLMLYCPSGRLCLCDLSTTDQYHPAFASFALSLHFMRRSPKRVYPHYLAFRVTYHGVDFIYHDGGEVSVGYTVSVLLTPRNVYLYPVTGFLVEIEYQRWIAQKQLNC
jgi:hypothetical protein